MKKQVAEWKSNAVQYGGLLLAVYVFWALNLEHRFLFQRLQPEDLADLLVIAGAVFISRAIVLTVNRWYRRGLAGKFTISFTLFSLLTFGVGLGYNGIARTSPLLHHPFELHDLLLALLIFSVWTYGFLLSSHLRRIERRYRRTAERLLPPRSGKPSRMTSS